MKILQKNPLEPISELKASAMGEAAILFDAGTSLQPPKLNLQEKIWVVSQKLNKVEGVFDVVVGMNNFLVSFIPTQINHESIKQGVLTLWQESNSAETFSTKSHVVDVIYGGEYLSDLQLVAEYSGLSIEEVIELHSHSQYTVFTLGSQPGLPYLGGLPHELDIPRRTSPRAKVESGAVIIAGGQASILSRTSACGWHVIGHTEYDVFNIENSQPAIFAPGDTVEFRVKGVSI